MFSVVLAAALATTGQSGLQTCFGYYGYGCYGCYGYGCYGCCGGYGYVVPVPVYAYPYATGTSNVQQQIDDVKASVEKLGDKMEDLEEATNKKFDAAGAKAKEIEAKVKHLRRKMKADQEKIKERQDSFEKDMTKSQTDLEKNVTEKFHQLQIKGLEDKIHEGKHDQLDRRIQKLELGPFEAKTSGAIDKINSRLDAMEKASEEKQQKEEFLKTLDQKLDMLQGNLRTQFGNVGKQFEFLNKQIQEERERREQFEKRLEKLENKSEPKTDNLLPLPKVPAEGKTSTTTDASTASRFNVPAGKALVLVTLPGDARLLLNGNETKAQGSSRAFLTPDLEPGATYAYTLRVDVVRNGQVVSQVRTVRFAAGQQVTVSFGQFANGGMVAAR